MPMDGLTVGFAARELNRMLQGGRVDKITRFSAWGSINSATWT